MVVNGILACFAAYAGLAALKVHAGDGITDAYVTGDLRVADDRKGEVGVLAFDINARLNGYVNAFEFDD